MQGYAGYINLINSSFLPKTTKRYILFLPNTVVVYKTGPLYWLSIEKLKGAQISSSKPTDISATIGLLHALSRILNMFSKDVCLFKGRIDPLPAKFNLYFQSSPG